MKPGYKTTEHAMAWAVIGLSGVAVCRGQQAVERVSAMVAPAVASAAYAASRGRAKRGRPRRPGRPAGGGGRGRRGPVPPTVGPGDRAAAVVPVNVAGYRAGRRVSRATGEVVYVLEFKAAPPAELVASDPKTLTETLMDSMETFFADLIVKAMHKSAPSMTAADDAAVTKTVRDFVTTGMDLAAVYFVLRNAKAAAATAVAKARTPTPQPVPPAMSSVLPPAPTYSAVVGK